MMVEATEGAWCVVRVCVAVLYARALAQVKVDRVP